MSAAPRLCALPSCGRQFIPTGQCPWRQRYHPECAIEAERAREKRRWTHVVSDGPIDRLIADLAAEVRP